MKYNKLHIINMMLMKHIIFYLNLFILFFAFFESIYFFDVDKKDELSFFEEKYELIEKGKIDKSFISYLYKDSSGNYNSKIFDYYTNEELTINDIIKEDKINEYTSKIYSLIFLKYPKFISEELIKETTKKSYLFRENELVIYFNDYNLDYEMNEVLYLKVNYNEIKDYINFTVMLDETYKNESGYNYTNSKKSIAFTFDDSPNKEKTTKILKHLNDNHSHATFFVVGEKCINNEDLLVSIKNNGNEIGSHTYFHQNLKKLNSDELISDYEMVNLIYKRLFKKDLYFLRPPYGLYNNSQLKVLNVSFIMWSLDTLDWKYRNSDYLVNYVLNNVKDGDIILFHDSYTSTVKAIEKLIPILYSRGYQIMSVSELANLKGYNIEKNTVYNKFS